MLGAFSEARADQFDDALIALGVLALVDGKGDIALADQLGTEGLDPACAGTSSSRSRSYCA